MYAKIKFFAKYTSAKTRFPIWPTMEYYGYRAIKTVCQNKYENMSYLQQHSRGLLK